MGDKETKKKKKKGSSRSDTNAFLDMTNMAMSSEYTGMVPTPADTKAKRKSYGDMLSHR